LPPTTGGFFLCLKPGRKERHVDERQLLSCLRCRHKGRRNAVKSTGLEARFDVSGKEIRDAVNALRRAGYPICSDETGYYYAETAAELKESINHLTKRIAGIVAARDGLMIAYREMGGDED
jgi:biotin operon repressor